MRAIILIAIALALAAAAAIAQPPCGVPQGEPCGSDTECMCMHGGEV